MPCSLGPGSCWTSWPRSLADTFNASAAPEHAVEAAQRVLADRDRFDLDDDALAAWEAINARRARELPGLSRLMERASPFAG